MPTPRIQTLNDLYEYLYVALQLEHATIPPYLLALYSIRPGTNVDATQVIRAVVVEEMLHLTLAANILNAVGGKPDLTAPGFVASYPTYLPEGIDDFKVDLQPFSKDAVETFLRIERPKKAPQASQMVSRQNNHVSMLKADAQGLHYFSIGEFYAEIAVGLNYLSEQLGSDLFKGKRSYQAGPEYFYSGGGNLTEVTDLPSALAAINLITEQGEGFDYGIQTKTGELSHDYRFEQLKLGRYYKLATDKPGNPTGEMLQVDWDAAYPFKKNAKLSDYEQSPELYDAAVAFNQTYADFLALLTRAYNGEPNLLLTEAVPRMFALRNGILRLIHNPIPGLQGVNAAPTFEMANKTANVMVPA
jgi:Ferritin-like